MKHEEKIYHDMSITGIIHNPQQEKLFLQMGEKIEGNDLLQFNSVIGWDLSPFEDQNILFDIQIFDNKNIPEWIKTDFNIPKEYLDLVNAGKTKIFYIEPSVGLGGYIVANEIILSDKL